MIKYIKGNLFNSSADALAHGCNTQGKMGAGIALEFKRRYPEMFFDYRQKCRSEEFKPGCAYMFKNTEKPHVINLATQEDLSGAKPEYIQSALRWLLENYESLKISTVAMPKIGAGLGGMQWEEVEMILYEYFEKSYLVIEVWSL